MISTENSTLSRAIIRYQGAPDADPTAPLTAGPTTGILVEADLRPLVPTPVIEPNVTMTFDLVVVRIRYFSLKVR
jgi:iron transport multicopper oxidase